MTKIIHLPDIVISKIAAGEVIERPAYIVKELIENAIDACARNIQISLEGYGLSKIVVTDDGLGMDHEDITICFLRHTTSKITSEEDIMRVQSMGFRGEALASIASIGKVTIRSRPKTGQYGSEVLVAGGVVKKISSKGMPTGTQVIVQDIFSYIPVRKKFLQSPQAEYRHILEVIQRFTLAYPDIAFEVSHEGKRVLTAGITDSLLARAEGVFSLQMLEQLFPLQMADEYITIEGFISPPQLNYKSSRNIHWYINKRFIHEPKFNTTVKRVYGTLLEPLSFPFVLLFITIPPHLIDVNVHPRKEKIHLLDSERLYNLLEQAISSTLSKHNLRFYDKRWNRNGASVLWELHDGGTKTYAAEVLKEKVTKKKDARAPIHVTEIVQMHNTYLVIPSPDGVILVDQHAAHERVLFEQFQEAFTQEKRKLNRITLEKPAQLDITLSEHELITEKREIFEQLGFHLEEKDGKISVIAVPELFNDRDVKQLVRDLLDDLFEQNTPSAYDTFSNTMIEYLACRSAIKAGDKLTKIQAKELIDELNKTKNPYTCPHGRPTQVELELPYFHRLFKRT